MHPTRRCNLRCLHCYSSSGPEEREALEMPLLATAISDAAALGYTVVGFSGGEPLMYRDLPALLDTARAAGLVTTVTSNGMLLDERRLRSLTGKVDLLAISLDGVPKSHDRMRASPHAFRSMANRLASVRESGIRFGFIFTLTQHNLHELDWVANFAADQGAELLQIHPLEEVGRATSSPGCSRPDEVESAFAYLEFVRIQERFGDRMHVQLDLADRDVLPLDPQRVFAGSLAPENASRSLGELVSPLIVEPDGTVVPVQYGFSRGWALGNLHDGRLPELSVQWIAERYGPFLSLCRSVFEDVAGNLDALPFLNWYELIAARAAQAS